MKTPVTVDIEGDADNPICVGFQEWGTEHAVVLERPNDLLLSYLADPDRPIFEWSKYDAKEEAKQGVDFIGPIWDGMVWAWLCNENTPLTLEWCAKRYLHVAMDKRIRSSAGQAVFKCDDGRDVPLHEAPLDQVMLYCGRDVTTETALGQKLQRRMQETGWWDYYRREHEEFTSLLMRMELRGLPVDLVASEKLREELEVEAAQLHEELLAEAELPEAFNLNSGPQLSQYLFSKVFELTDGIDYGSDIMECIKSCLGGVHEDCMAWDAPQEADISDGTRPAWIHIVDLLPIGYTLSSPGRTIAHGLWTLRGLGLPPGIATPSGDRPSTSSPALLTNFAAASHPWVTKLLRYRKMTKVLTTYLRKWPEQAVEGRVHGRFNQTGTVTGRLSSSGPNLQNIPAHGDLGPRVRALFKAEPGTALLVGDYSQLEPRLMAHFSQDPLLLDVYRSGRDIYLAVAEIIWGEVITKEDERRGIAKTYVLALGYGAGAKKLQQILTINGYSLSLYEVERHLAQLRIGLERLFRWREATIREAKRTGYVTTLAGQHRRLAAQFKQTTWKARGYGERQSVNARIQGSAGDIVRRGMLEAERRFPQAKLLAQVHDETVAEVALVDVAGLNLPEYGRVYETGHGFNLSVPLVFEANFGDNWYAAKEGSTFILPEDFGGGFEDDDAELEEVT